MGAFYRLSRMVRRVRTLRARAKGLYLAFRDARTPWYAKAMIGAVAIYALSPVDLIPDFIPVVGWLDDVVLIPIGLALAVRLVPRHVMAECRARAEGKG